ncbi:MAG TPA: di-heme oxidoredictase family protein [Candidatus Dormibacteraeota bacterium]|nr:di-heme oxidoredictase family protein [Candidatus Dormibacteraeota bacterium]
MLRLYSIPPAGKAIRVSLYCVVLLFLPAVTVPLAFGQAKDPGPRTGAAGAGGFFSTLNSNEQTLFSQAQLRFAEVDSVSGTIESGVGLGPTFNGNSCAMCHAQPAMGGSSPGQTSPQNPVPNPQVALAKLDGATNTVPSFITSNGPVREARFVATDPTNVYSGLDGGVHDLYTIQGRTDAKGCILAQPNFSYQQSYGNVIFRTPTPLFGLGLVENTPDATLQSNLNSTSSARYNLGIAGSFNTSGNDGTITRFGWKAQNKSLLIFASEAYNVEQGVTNEGFPNERNTTAGCVFNATPEDGSNILNPNQNSVNFRTTIGTVSEMSSDVVNFALFMRLLAPPTPAQSNSSISNGSTLFSQIGCNLCHSTSLTTGTSPFTGMSNVTYHPYSDFALHHMGAGLADGIEQGAAGADQFRTAPLWGLGQRLFFLHDGRTTDLVSAIQSHYFSTNYYCTQVSTAQLFYVLTTNSVYEPEFYSNSCNSEANSVINNYNALTSSQQQDLLNFLRSL